MTSATLITTALIAVALTTAGGAAQASATPQRLPGEQRGAAAPRYVVTSRADNGRSGSLRSVLATAENDGKDSTVVLRPGDEPYELTRCPEDLPPAGREVTPPHNTPERGDLEHRSDSDEALTILGNGAAIRQRCPHDRVLHFSGKGVLRLDHVTLEGGRVGRSTLEENGGGVLVDGGGRLELYRSRIHDNRAANLGGGVAVLGSSHPTLVMDSTIDGNASASGGGGIATLGSLELVNSTVTGNWAPTSAAITSGSLRLRFSTVYANLIRGRRSQMQVAAEEIIPFASVVSDGEPGADHGCAVVRSRSQGHNLGEKSCGFGDTGRDSTEDPLFLALNPNGGFAPTLAPGPRSPLIDQVPFTLCLPTNRYDGRGESRVAAGSGCDIGAVEAGTGVIGGSADATPVLTDVSFTG